MAWPYAQIKTAVTGDILTATDYNNEHQNHITNNDPGSINDDSPTATQMKVTVSPGTVGGESLATTLQGEIERLRYVIKTMHGEAQWYPGEALLPTAGGTMTGNIAMGTHKLTGLAAGSGSGDSLRYEQLVGLYLLLTGGTLSGAINMGSNKITSLANGTATTDAMAFGQNHIVQIVIASNASDFSTSNVAYQSTALTASITPGSASNKVLVWAMAGIRVPSNGVGAQASLFNGSTDLLSGNGAPQLLISTGGLSIVPWSAMWMDSPASTSAQTYTVKLRNTNGAGTVLFTDTQFMLLVEVP